MGYIDLIPDVFRLTMPDLATGKSYHTQKFNVGNKQCIGVTIKASQALSVAVAYGIATDTAAAAGVDIAASLPYKTSATSFASNTSTEGGTYHEIAVPPHARQAQLVISNASGSTVSGAVIDAALRVVAYPAASGSGSSDFASITGWPGSSSQFVHADGSYSPLSASDISTDLGTSTGTANALAGASLVDTSNTFETGRLYWIKANLANTGATTLAKNGGTAVHIRKNPNSAALAGGDIAANALVLLYFNGTYLQLMAGRSLAITDVAWLTMVLNEKLSKINPVTGGSSSAYTLTDASIGAPVIGDLFAFRPHTNNSSSCTLAVNGGTAYPLTRPVNNSGSLVYNNLLSANQIGSSAVCLAVFDGFQYVLISGYAFVSTDIPGTLNETAFAGPVKLTGAQTSPGAGIVSFYRDSGGNGFINVGPGVYLNLSCNGSTRMQLDVVNLTTAGNLGVTGGVIWPNGSALSALQLQGSTAANGAQITLRSNSNTLAGTLLCQSSLITRSNSVNYGFETVTSVDYCRFMLIDDAGKAAWGFCTGAGTVTVDAASHADYVATASPTSGQVGINWISNVLRMTMGSAATRKIATFTWLAKG